MNEQDLKDFEGVFGEGSVALLVELNELQSALPKEQAQVIERAIDMLNTGIQMLITSNHHKYVAAADQALKEAYDTSARYQNAFAQSYTEDVLCCGIGGEILKGIIRRAGEAGLKAAKEG